MTERRLPPVTEVAAASMVLVIVAVIYLASYLPRQAPLGLAVGLLVASAVLFAANLVLLARVRDFAWWRFFQVGRWAVLAYLIIAGMIEYAFVYDKTRGTVLVVMTLLLALFAANVPVILAFTVARFEATRPAAGRCGAWPRWESCSRCTSPGWSTPPMPAGRSRACCCSR